MAGRVLTVIALAFCLFMPNLTAAPAAPQKSLASSSLGAFNNSTDPSWAGYEVTAPNYLDYVTTDFIVPSVTCPSTGIYSVSMWAGLGKGWSSDPLYQTGVRLLCDSGTETIYPWWEQVPDTSGENNYNHTVSAGDKIVAEVVLGGNVVDLYLQDYGSNLSNPYPNWSAHTQIDVGSHVSPSIAECIVEDPTLTGSTLYSLLNFGTVNFSTDSSASFNKACDVTANNTDHVISSSSSGLNNGITGVSVWDIYESFDSSTLATTSDQSSSGAFSVTWQASQ